MISWVTDQVGITNLEGGIEAAQEDGLVVICLVPIRNPSALFQFDLREHPFSEHMMDGIAMILETLVQNGKRVVVHCFAGVERSPLVVAWWISRTQHLTIDEAYQRVMDARPGAQDRRHWVPEAYPEGETI